MSTYRYKISMSYYNTLNSKTIDIRVESIKSFCIEKDYDKMNMPIAFMELVLDKNLVDDIILNAKDNLFNIFVYNFADEGDQYSKKVFQGQFTYFLQDDINYNKDLDYTEAEKELNDGIERNDKYRTILLGLMMKSNLDDNKKVVNDIAYNTSMVNIVAAITSDISILIEPFAYNNTIEQLIIPPLETLSKALEYLNKISVFYDTKYRFFLDYDIAYLLSSSGDAVKKSDEKYSSILIDIRNVISEDAFEEGMKEDEEQDCYVIPISTTDTVYQTNNITDKDFNNIQAILDSSKKQTETKSSKVKSTVSRLLSAAKKINTAVKSVQKQFANVGNTLTKMKYDIAEDVETALDTNVEIAGVVVKIENVFSQPGISTVIKNEALKDIISISKDVETVSKQIEMLPNQYESMRDKVFNNVCNAGSFDSYVNGVEAINIPDNLGGMNRLLNNVTTQTKSNKNDVDTILSPVSDKYRQINTKIDRIITLINGLPDKIESSTGGSGSSSSGDSSGSTSIDVSEAKTYIAQLEALKSPITSCADRMDENVNTISTMNTMCDTTVTLCGNSITDISATPNILKDEFQGSGAITVSGLASSVNSSATKAASEQQEKLNKISIKGFSDIGKAQLDRLTSMGDSFLDAIRTGIDGISDISNIGSTGVTEVVVDVDVNGSEASKDKAKLIRVPNDNANLIKQLKSEIELSTARLVINKNGLDSLIISPNKEYTVKNYDTHSKRNGKFLLSNKKEVFIREDDTFIMNTILTLRQIPNSSK